MTEALSTSQSEQQIPQELRSLTLDSVTDLRGLQLETVARATENIPFYDTKAINRAEQEAHNYFAEINAHFLSDFSIPENHEKHDEFLQYLNNFSIDAVPESEWYTASYDEDGNKSSLSGRDQLRETFGEIEASYGEDEKTEHQSHEELYEDVQEELRVRLRKLSTEDIARHIATMRENDNQTVKTIAEDVLIEKVGQQSAENDWTDAEERNELQYLANMAYDTDFKYEEVESKKKSLRDKFIGIPVAIENRWANRERKADREARYTSIDDDAERKRARRHDRVRLLGYAALAAGVVAGTVYLAWQHGHHDISNNIPDGSGQVGPDIDLDVDDGHESNLDIDHGNPPVEGGNAVTDVSINDSETTDYNAEGVDGADYDAARDITPGEGWTGGSVAGTFDQMGVPAHNQATLLELVGPKLHEIGVAYIDHNLPGSSPYGINMTTDGRMPVEALEVIIDTARDNDIPIAPSSKFGL